jgi:hypothetical protein
MDLASFSLEKGHLPAQRSVYYSPAANLKEEQCTRNHAKQRADTISEGVTLA